MKQIILYTCTLLSVSFGLVSINMQVASAKYVEYVDAPLSFIVSEDYKTDLEKAAEAKKSNYPTFLDYEGAIYIYPEKRNKINENSFIYVIYGTPKELSLDEIKKWLETNRAIYFKDYELLTLEETKSGNIDAVKIEFNFITNDTFKLFKKRTEIHTLQNGLYIVGIFEAEPKDYNNIEKEINSYLTSLVLKQHSSSSSSARSKTQMSSSAISSNSSSSTEKIFMNPFVDVSESSKYLEAITWSKSQTIFEGYSDGTFKPNASINRAELVKILIEATGGLPKTNSENSSDFTDVDTSAWYGPYVKAAKNRAIIQGYSDNTFKPANAVNTAEALKIIYETLNIPVSETSGEWYKKYLQHAKMHGVLFSNSMRMDNNISRQDIAWILWKLSKQESSSSSSDIPIEITEDTTTVDPRLVRLFNGRIKGLKNSYEYFEDFYKEWDDNFVKNVTSKGYELDSEIMEYRTENNKEILAELSSLQTAIDAVKSDNKKLPSTVSTEDYLFIENQIDTLEETINRLDQRIPILLLLTSFQVTEHYLQWKVKGSTYTGSNYSALETQLNEMRAYIESLENSNEVLKASALNREEETELVDLIEDLTEYIHEVNW